jgi:hypothetical protein
MALQAVPDYGINVPDAGKAFEEGMMFRQQQQAQLTQRAEAEELKKAIGSLGPNPSVQSINALIVKYPALAERFKKPLEILSDEERQVKQGRAVPIYAAMQNGKPEVAKSLLQQEVDALRNSGNEKGARDAEAQIKLIEADPGSATTTFGVVLSGIMGPDNFQKTFGELREQQLQPEKVAEAKAKAAKLAQNAGIEPFQVKYWTNGVTMVIGKNNEQMVRDASGKVLTGADADAAVRSGMNSEVVLAGGKAGAAAAAEAGVRATTEPGIAADIDAAKAAVVIGTEAFKKIAPIKKNISNYDEAIRLIEREGANTGIIASRLPSLFASSIELDNLGQTMGVESLAGGGFGTLSDSDVRLSIQRALPKGLEGPELVAWLKRKKAVDLKYVSELERAAKFMQKGRTLADFLEANGNQASAPAAAAPANDMAAAAAAELARRRGGG